MAKLGSFLWFLVDIKVTRTLIFQISLVNVEISATGPGKGKRLLG